MTFDYALFTEEWASIYKPMRHEMGAKAHNKHFFICDSYRTMTNFMASMKPTSSPCVITESHQEGEVNNGFDYPTYAFYFMVRAGKTHDGDAAIKAKREAKQTMMDFVNFLRAFKDNDADALSKTPMPTDSYLASLFKYCQEDPFLMANFSLDKFTYDSIDELYDGWYGVILQITDVQPLQKCIDTAQYI